jgi:hypothetical protein
MIEPNIEPSIEPRIEPSADVDDRAVIGAGTLIWHLAQVREHARVGSECVIGRGAYVGPGVVVGDRCKIQNHALLYEPAVLEDGAFVGPAVVFTNDYLPRAVNPDGTLKDGDDWHAVGVTVRTGASIGARAVCVAPVTNCSAAIPLLVSAVMLTPARRATRAGAMTRFIEILLSLPAIAGSPPAACRGRTADAGAWARHGMPSTSLPAVRFPSGARF